MLLISHRGNINGKNPDKENHPDYILEAIKQGYECEVDVWRVEDRYWLGHDQADYEIDFLFLTNPKLWIHAKNVHALTSLMYSNVNVFWHQEDDYTITNKGYVWAYPGKYVLPESKAIAVLPEQSPGFNVSNFSGVCSDYIKDYDKVSTV